MKQTPGSANLEIQGRMVKCLHLTLQLEWFRKLINFLPTHFLPCLARQAIILFLMKSNEHVTILLCQVDHKEMVRGIF